NEGIASSMHLTFTGGDIHVWAVEDGINANNDDVSEITITGGSMFVETETGDGIDSNGTITITGGAVTTVSSTADMNGGLDADGDVTIDGGEVIATGARLSVPVAASAQHSLLLQFEQPQPAGTLVVVQDAAGETLLAFAPGNEFRQLLFSDPRIVPLETYNIYMDAAPEGEAVNGRYAAVSDPGEPAGTATTASLDEARQRPGPGGPPPDDAEPPAA
ncbi:MAG: carbohydrate-binding domain-containing protein, partial [Thermomicrobiales bacterium]